MPRGSRQGASASGCERYALGPKFSQAYFDALFSSPDCSKLVELCAYLPGAGCYSPSEPCYGYPQPVFVFVESLVWFSQAIRSGAWTYYEATPGARQDAMLDALKCEAPTEFATHYALGMRDWRDEQKIEAVDMWMQNHDEDNNRWLWRLVNKHRSAIERLCGQVTAPISGTRRGN